MSAQNKDPQSAKEKLPQNLNPDSDLPPDADLEERFNDFWKNNAGGIFGGIALGAVLVLGVQLYRHLDNKAEMATRTAFAETVTIEDKLAFAEDHRRHSLAALALLSAADMKFEAGNFAEAAPLYGEAARGFQDPAFASRALLGQGMSLLAMGQEESAHAILEAVARDRSALQQIRGEAAYHLAVLRWQNGETDKALEVLAIIETLSNARIWSMRGG